MNSLSFILSWLIYFKDGAYFCWCAHVLRITQATV